MTGSGNSLPSTQPSEIDQQQAAVSKPQTIREFEAAMRKLGFSRSEASAIASKGFKSAVTAESDDSEQLQALEDAVHALTKQFKD